MIDRRWPLAAAALLTAVGTASLLLQPPVAQAVAAPAWPPRSVSVAGAFHVHTNRSDGSGSVDEVARAAERAGLQFVVITDHGDGSAPTEPPAYRSNVLVIDGVELNTGDGHYAAVGTSQPMSAAASGGPEVARRVTALGGFGVVSHGDSEKSGLEWRAWDAEVGGVEWTNFDSAWRTAPAPRLARAVLTYWLRGPESLASLLARPALMSRYDELTRRRRVVSIAATDAHGPVPSYETCFRTMTTRVELNAPFSGDAAADAGAITAALAAGHHHTVIDALARPAAFEFVGRAEQEWAATGRTARQGDTVPGGGLVTLEARVAGPAGATMVLMRDGVVLRETRAGSLIYGVDGTRAVYRVEVRVAGAPGNPPMPWIVSNPIYVGY